VGGNHVAVDHKLIIGVLEFTHEITLIGSGGGGATSPCFLMALAALALLAKRKRRQN
jgi:MYXO-CTERM domain-containing protein